MRFSLIAALILLSPAFVRAEVITGSGTYDLGGTWHFSFEVANPVDYSGPFLVTNAEYDSNGVVSTVPIIDVVFFPDDGSGGLFNVDFQDFPPFALFQGNNIVDLNNTLIPGAYSIRTNSFDLFGGPLTGRITVGNGPFAAVPEPSSVVLLGLGGIGLVIGGYLRRRTTAA